MSLFDALKVLPSRREGGGEGLVHRARRRDHLKKSQRLPKTRSGGVVQGQLKTSGLFQEEPISRPRYLTEPLHRFSAACSSLHSSTFRNGSRTFRNGGSAVCSAAIWGWGRWWTTETLWHPNPRREGRIVLQLNSVFKGHSTTTIDTLVFR